MFTTVLFPQNDVDRVRELLRQGANPNVRDHAGWIPLVGLGSDVYHCLAWLLEGRFWILRVLGWNHKESSKHVI